VLFFQAATAELNARIEIIDPFPAWFATEKLELFVRVTNTGDLPLPLMWTGGSRRQFFFESILDPKYAQGKNLEMPKVEDAQGVDFKGFMLPPGRAYVLSGLDYDEAEMVQAECFTRVRVHFLIKQGQWVSSDFVERKIIEQPNLKVQSLFDFKLTTQFERSLEIIPLRVEDETWLFSHETGSSNVGRRLCRLPAGFSPTFRYDIAGRRLFISFGQLDEPAVINTRTGMPVSGSERTVPHLRLWQELSGRPFTDSWQDEVERVRGENSECDRTKTTVPAEIEPKHRAIPGASSLQHSFRETPAGNPIRSESGKFVGPKASETKGLLPWWTWILGGSSLIAAGWFSLRRYLSRK